jgi:uncharacterized protein YegL
VDEIRRPIYLACDLSGGSDRYAGMLNAITQYHLYDALAHAHIRIHLIGFSPSAHHIASLDEESFTETLSFPAVGQSATSGYGALFSLVMTLTQEELREANESGTRLFRPILIVIAGALPSADDALWEPYRALMAWRGHPNVIAISLSEDTSGIAARMASDIAFSASGIDPITELIISIIHDFFSSRPRGGNSLIIRKIDGLVRLEMLS